MSFILDALKKSESERQRQIAPGVIDPGFIAPRAGLPPWVIAVLVLLGINLLVLSAVLLRRLAPAPNRAAASPPAAFAQIGRSAPSAAAPNPVATAPFSPMDNTAQYAPEIPLATTTGTAAAARPRAAYPPARQVSAAARRESAATVATVDDEEVLPTLGELNLTGADKLPPLHLDVHVYAAKPAGRFVFINGQKYVEGSTLQEGPVIERIRRDGVVLRFHGRRFLLPRQ